MDCFTSPNTSKFPKFTIIPGLGSQLLNPGSVSNLHQKTRNIKPIWLDGVHLEFRKNFENNKIFFCNWVLSHTNPTGFRLGGIYNRALSDHVLVTPRIEADINPSTLLANFSFLWHPISSIRLELNSHNGSTKNNSKTMSIEYIGDKSTASVIINKLSPNSTNLSVDYMYSLSSNWCIGTELSQLYDGRIAQSSQVAIAVRHQKDAYSWAGTLSTTAADISYWHQIHKSLQLGTILCYNQRSGKSVSEIFYQYEFKNGYIRGMIDSNWSVGVTYNR